MIGAATPPSPSLLCRMGRLATRTRFFAPHRASSTSSSSGVANMHRISPDAVVSTRVPPDRHRTPHSASSTTKPGTLPLRTIYQPAPRAEPSRLLGLSRSLPISRLPCFPPNEAASRSPASAPVVGRTTSDWSPCTHVHRSTSQTAWPRLSSKSATDACMLPSPQLRDGALLFLDCHPHPLGTMTRGNFVESLPLGLRDTRDGRVVRSVCSVCR
ncbi:hypothetical protein B0H14DRAFT_2945282 [Mycena olivaceomarginata]|nr:hypothetical protein B0H14DRAFT_2945282 [Mycena olivaceomarginata]